MAGDLSEMQDRPAVSVSLLLMRLVVGVIFMAHGAQLMFGAWGGPGISAFVQPPPAGLGPIGYLVATGQFFGGLGLIIGVLTRFSAASLIVIMLGAIFMVHIRHGFFLGGPETPLKDVGFEYNVALIGLLLPILLAGPGRFAVCRYLTIPKSKTTGRTLLFFE